jgi:predicted RNA-binding Zn-ribbon protein involved in translation (DUF1610 family)
MRCPKCGTEMNHHADKVVEAEQPEDARLVDPELEGIVQEIYSCPSCGWVESRRPAAGE